MNPGPQQAGDRTIDGAVAARPATGEAATDMAGVARGRFRCRGSGSRTGHHRMGPPAQPAEQPAALGVDPVDEAPIVATDRTDRPHPPGHQYKAGHRCRRTTTAPRVSVGPITAKALIGPRQDGPSPSDRTRRADP